MINKDIRVAAIPIDIAWGDRDENIYVAGELIKNLPADVDIAVLPELFTTGFITDPGLMAANADTPSNSPTLTAMRALAKERNMAICFSMLWHDGDNYYNRGVFIEPSGETTVYDKRHLFAPSEEARILTAGCREVPVVRFRGWNVAMCICYDLRFPVWMRNVEYKYDLMLLPANWPDSRGYAFRQLLIGRAIENQAAIVGANRSGHDDYGIYDAQTFMFDHMGSPVGDIASDSGIVIGKFDIDAIRTARTRFPALRHADTFRLTNS